MYTVRERCGEVPEPNFFGLKLKKIIKTDIFYTLSRSRIRLRELENSGAGYNKSAPQCCRRL